MLLQTTRTAGLVGSALGVMVGCLIGMFPLLFMPDSEVVEAVKRKEKVMGRSAGQLFAFRFSLFATCFQFPVAYTELSRVAIFGETYICLCTCLRTYVYVASVHRLTPVDSSLSRAT